MAEPVILAQLAQQLLSQEAQRRQQAGARRDASNQAIGQIAARRRPVGATATPGMARRPGLGTLADQGGITEEQILAMLAGGGP